MSTTRSPAAASMRRHVWFGFVLIVTLVGTSTIWGLLASLESAVVTQGTVVVESNIKKVQHPTGGVVGQLLVREGQRVVEGEVVVRLDETIARANVGIVSNDLTALRARMARLLAERDARDAVTFPPDILARAMNEPTVAQVVAGEEQLFKVRAMTKRGLQSQLTERIGQSRNEIVGLAEQKRATDVQLRVAREELRGLQKLATKGLVQGPRLTALDREIARSEGTMGEISARISQVQGKIAETELQILQLEKETATEVAKDLREAETKIGELNERLLTAEDFLRRIDIRAPISGVVHQLAVHTVGGVIGQTEPLMLIVPDTEKLVVEVRINPQDIDQVMIGLPVRVRFSAFNQRTTPELTGVLTRLAGDLTREQQTGQTFYTGGVSIAETEMIKLSGQKLIPGMPADAYIRTGERSPMSYLVKPFVDQLQKAMRER